VSFSATSVMNSLSLKACPRSSASRLPSKLELQVVIFLVRPDPCPKETLFGLEMTDGTVMRSYADRPEAASKRFEMEGWVAKIPKPETVGLRRKKGSGNKS